MSLEGVQFRTPVFPDSQEAPLESHHADIQQKYFIGSDHGPTYHFRFLSIIAQRKKRKPKRRLWILLLLPFLGSSAYPNFPGLGTIPKINLQRDKLKKEYQKQIEILDLLKKNLTSKPKNLFHEKIYGLVSR